MYCIQTLKGEGEMSPSPFKFIYILLLLILTISSFNLSAQDDNEIQNKFQFGFNVGSTFIPKPSITREFGNAELLTHSTFGFEAGLSLNYKLTKYFVLTSGIIYGKLPYSWGFDFKQGEFASLNGNQFYAKGAVYDINYWYFPFNLETMIYKSKKAQINLLTGINIRHYLDGQTSQGYQYGYLDSSKANQDFFLVVLDVNYPYQIRLNYQLGTNIYFKLKNLNDFKISLLYNFSFSKIVNGNYGFFQDTPEYTFGSYSMTGSYLFLGFGYVLTGERKLRQLNEY